MGWHDGLSDVHRGWGQRGKDDPQLSRLSGCGWGWGGDRQLDTSNLRGVVELGSEVWLERDLGWRERPGRGHRVHGAQREPLAALSREPEQAG